MESIFDQFSGQKKSLGFAWVREISFVWILILDIFSFIWNFQIKEQNPDVVKSHTLQKQRWSSAA